MAKGSDEPPSLPSPPHSNPLLCHTISFCLVSSVSSVPRGGELLQAFHSLILETPLLLVHIWECVDGG